ncbi:uncharacterized protein LOC129756990 isoform X2 [Uranotaenia lowii]|uniref:uncharacterized protein LOC129756990 isoform X2 n=1 Tax=Uranotaenia lowii TaxID=190385 RepID=UPI00247925D2|nr:uncharacterized protein LOC129756990 isoform X2 [Uranotaenia lowii]
MSSKQFRLAMLIHRAYVCSLMGLLVTAHFAAAICSDANADCENDTSASKSKRSALPILNNVEGRGKDFLIFDNHNEVDQDVKPSAALVKQRSGKDLLDDSFQYNKNVAMNLTGKSPNTPPFIMANNLHNGRQNSNPDIQDIITGIVKLLNGNVNVHANTQPTRRYSATRINNRGPPRISDANPAPNDFENEQTTSSRPPYNFERPETPVRPFITGVPIPEQIVPSMQQTFRPGFVSQNRPPWQRPKPRPPISPNRRPMPPYKPYPTNVEYGKPESDPANHPVTTNDNILQSETTTTTTEKYQEESDTKTTTETDNHEIITEIPISENKEVTKPPRKSEKPRKPAPEVKYTIDTPTSSSETPIEISTTTSSEQFQTEVPSVYEINSIEYLPSDSGSTASYSLEPSISGESFITTKELITPTKTMTSTTSSSTSSTTTTSTVISSSSTTTTMAPNHKPEQITTTPSSSSSTPTPALTKTTTDYRFHPRPGLVLDDPDFKPGGNKNPIRTQNPYMQAPDIQTRPQLPPNYGEIFDVTLSAIQGPAGSGSQQTVKINPYYNRPPQNQPNDPDDASIILTANGNDGFVSIDGKRSYIDLFGESKTTTQQPPVQIIPTTTTTEPLTRPTKQTLQPGVTGIGQAVAETEPPPKTNNPSNKQNSPMQHRPQQHRPKYPLPPVRIDTCIVGDDSTCDQAQNERCKTENGVSSCHCRPGYARRKHREPCRRIVSLMLSMRVDKIYERRIVWDSVLANRDSEKFQQLSYEAVRAMDSAMSMTPFSDEFMDARVNSVYTTNPAASGIKGVFVNYTISLDENAETLRPQLKSDIQRHLLGVLHRRNNNIGNSALYVDSPTGAVSSVQDVDECTSEELNDCDEEASCSNLFGTFRCECNFGYRDPWADQPQRAGRECLSCPDSYCNNRGSCMFDNANNKQVCKCVGSYYGAQCEIDGEVLGVAVGASVAAVVIIVLTLICLIMWSRKWQREHKNAMGSPVFGYMGGAQVKTPVMGQAPYQVTLEDRMRWAQIADVMAQANHYAAEPIAPPRPASAMFGYPGRQMGTLSTLSMHGTLPPMHAGTLPPVPLPRSLGIGRNGMRTLENSSSSEEEDRADLLGRNFNVPRPKSRSNASVTSGIYYDVDYAPTGADQMYGISSSLVGPAGTGSGGPAPSIPASKGQPSIPMSTYTSSSTRPVQTTYYK